MARFDTIVLAQAEHIATVRTTLTDGPDEVTLEHTCDVSDASEVAQRCAAQGGLGADRLARLRADVEQRARDEVELLAREQLLTAKHGPEQSPEPRPGRSKTARELDRERLEAARTGPRGEAPARLQATRRQ